MYHRGNISPYAFLAIMGFLARRVSTPVAGVSGYLSVRTLVACLRGTRTCFLSFQLPRVHHGLASTVTSYPGSITFIVAGFFSRCTTRIRGRVSCRRGAMFPCIQKLLGKVGSPGCGVAVFQGRRSRVRVGVVRLGGVLVGCCPKPKDGLLGDILFSVFTARRSLTSRGRMRSCLFIPTVLALRGAVR